MKPFVFLGIIACLLARPAAAQVGYPATGSPFRDVPFKQEVTLYGGHFGGWPGQAGVGPRGGTIIGLRYGITVGGPAEFSAHLARIGSSRMVIDPARDSATRVLGTESLPLYLLDADFTLNLTGRKTFHHMIPDVTVGAGVLSNFGAQADTGGFKIGTPFALMVGAGVRYLPGGRYALRLDLADYLYHIHYPPSYFKANASTGAPAVLPSSATAGPWAHGAVITLGISYLYSQ